MKSEIWKPIKGWEGLYHISNCGRVKSLARIWYTGNGYGIRSKPDTILINKMSNVGYYIIALRYKPNELNTTVHSLVWDHFGDRQRNGRILQVDHIDGNKLNNHISNLQLLSPRSNTSKGKLCYKKSSPYTGVCHRPDRNIWTAQIEINKKRVHLGSYGTPEQASEAYQNKLKEINDES